MADATFIKRVKLKNYRSIASCDVQLGPLNFLVGPNGSGKSNFLDALRFVSDSLRQPLSDSLAARDGPWAMQWHSNETTPPPDISIELDFILPEGGEGRYSLRLGAEGMRSENLRIDRPSPIGSSYEVLNGTEVVSNVVPVPAAMSDRLYLVNASGLPLFRPVYDALTHMGIYSISPEILREIQPISATQVLARDGANLNSILLHLGIHERENYKNELRTKRLIVEYLAAVVPGVKDIVVDLRESKAALFFNQPSDSRSTRLFGATSMSDGTLRALGNLVALFQIDTRTSRRPSLVGIEEPEAALHPAAVGVLLHAMREASDTTQVIVTSHSPDLLDHDDIPEEQILAVEMKDGATRIDRIDEASRSALEEHLSTPGELLRLNQLQPESATAKPR
jgi:predicted ATPase